jgi:hypothetical protein
MNGERTKERQRAPSIEIKEEKQTAKCEIPEPKQNTDATKMHE